MAFDNIKMDTNPPDHIIIYENLASLICLSTSKEAWHYPADRFPRAEITGSCDFLKQRWQAESIACRNYIDSLINQIYHNPYFKINTAAICI